MARMHRRSRRYERRERKIQHRQWFTTTQITNSTVTLKQGDDTDNLIKIAVDQFKGDDQTILRTRGIFSVINSALGADCIGVLGGVVLPNKTAANASTDDLPNPLVDSDTTDWFVWYPFFLEGNTSDSGSETPEDALLREAQHMNIDSKAKRIMEASESVVWVLGLNAENAVSSKSIKTSLCLRTLVGY